ncbi:integral membrane protein [Paenibacillus sp. UNCCL117]|uniref:DUF3817 domain-containing protein n=1 Tax=unclassified Paenibacillus TaxID=185978 RepID=UPI000883199F|nr:MULTISPECIES: DUF3817 domain-containing protein [unclassified Paenibacillus]SDD02939.1 integral membrane protein [Paenibacillus sp. cl123]SFW32398.1 integral membrane protein [Paenibacillus sp. UNCCL117]
MKKYALQSFRVISFLEGISFLVLLLIAMPLKYMADKPEAVSVTGSIHGFLFGIYLIAVVAMAILFRWKLIRISGAVLAAFLPFGPFVLDRRIKHDT